MNFSRMQKAKLVLMAERFRLPVANPASLKIGHLRELLEDHFPKYLEIWFLNRVKQDLLPATGLNLPGHLKHYIPGTQLEFDYSWKSIRLAVEIQGGIDSPHRKSGHVSPKGMRSDMRKVCLAQLNGWMLLQLPPEAITDDYEWMRNTLPMLIAAVSMCRHAPRLRELLP